MIFGFCILRGQKECCLNPDLGAYPPEKGEPSGSILLVSAAQFVCLRCSAVSVCSTLSPGFGFQSEARHLTVWVLLHSLPLLCEAYTSMLRPLKRNGSSACSEHWKDKCFTENTKPCFGFSGSTSLHSGCHLSVAFELFLIITRFFSPKPIKVYAVEGAKLKSLGLCKSQEWNNTI